MYIEDLIITLSSISNNRVEPRDLTIIISLGEQILNDKPYTEKQRVLAVQLLIKYQHLLVLDKPAIIYLTAPKFKYNVRVLNGVKYISVSDHKILVKFPFNTQLVDSFRTYKRTLSDANSNLVKWNSLIESWEFPLDERSLVFLNTLIYSGFNCDDEFRKYSQEVQNIQTNIEKYIPMITYCDSFKFENVHVNCPQPSSNNLLDVLLEAKLYGITVWDDHISKLLKDLELSKAMKQYIKCVPNIRISGLDEITSAIEHSKLTLFVIPGGLELELTTIVHDWILENNYTPRQISVVFRNETTVKTCNEYVRANKLDNDITSDTRFIFVTGKIPKPLIKANCKFDLVLQYGSDSAHYNLKNFIVNHHNVIRVNTLRK